MTKMLHTCCRSLQQGYTFCCPYPNKPCAHTQQSTNETLSLRVALQNRFAIAGDQLAAPEQTLGLAGCGRAESLNR